MNRYEKIGEIKKFTDSVGSIYGTEDFNVYLYSIVKMIKPRSVLELGTGLGSSSLWIALGLEENNSGTLFTVDDGSEWDRLKVIKQSVGGLYKEEYASFIEGLIEHFQFKDRVKFYNEKVTTFGYSDKYDIVFSDFSHGPYFIIKLIAEILPKMEDNSFIFIDSASTYYPSYHTLESLISLLNAGKIPKTVKELIPNNTHNVFVEKVLSSKFELTHIIENKDRNQNSTAQIKISPIDIMPQPRVSIRF